MTKLSKRAKLWVLGLVVAILAVVALASALRPPGDTLTRKATRIADIGDWSPFSDTYGWTSEHEILTLKGGLAGGRYEGNHWTYEAASRVNLNTGSRRYDADLGQALGQVWNGVPLWSVSPDGRRLLWCKIAGTRAEWRSTELETRDTLAVPATIYRSDVAQTVWRYDSEGWVHLRDERPCEVRTFDLKHHSPVVQTLDADPWHYLLAGWIAPGRLLAVQPWSGPDGRGRAIQIPIGQKTPIVDYPELPSGAQHIEEVSISPDGRRAAWIVVGTDVLTGRMSRLITRGRWRPPSYTALYVSRADMTGFSEVGRVRARSLGQQLCCARWSPDSKKLSFVFAGSLWIVPL